MRHGSFKDASVILPAYEEMKRFVLLDRKGGAGGIEAIGAQRAFLAARRGIEEMARMSRWPQESQNRAADM
ncbi:MAG: hypothetical protein ACLRX5_00260 [Slackia sp.]